MTASGLISVVISASVSPDMDMKVYLDGGHLGFVSGTATVSVAAGEHSLMWFVLGVSGTKYALSIDQPSSVGFHTGATLTALGSDHGTTWFSV